MVKARASRPNMRRLYTPSTVTRFKPGTYRFELRWTYLRYLTSYMQSKLVLLGSNPPYNSEWFSQKRQSFCRAYSWMGHKTYGRCVLFGSANSFANTTAIARSIEGACGMSPYLSALETPQSKLRTSLRGLYSQSGDFGESINLT